jgi:diacylglycerol kinase (ATP)
VTKHKIGFIVHSGSGSKRKQQAKEDFEAYILKDTGYDLFKLDKAEDIVEVTADMALKNYEAVYACGGDGTLNLVSGGLIHTETALGIIPFGSGNGYARHHEPARYRAYKWYAFFKYGWHWVFSQNKSRV